MGNNDQPRTGNGQTGGQKPKRLQVTVKTPTGTVLWQQTSDLHRKKAPKTAKTKSTPPPVERRKRNPLFDN
jgi:hypothetical protein